MFKGRLGRLVAPRSIPATLALVLLQVAPVFAQEPAFETAPIVHKVAGPTERLEMVVNGSRLLTLDQKIPRAQVNNRELLDLTPLSPTEIQVFAKKAGVTQINLWNEKGQVHAIDVLVLGDARELSLLLQNQFPHSNIKVTPLANSVVLSGFVERSDHVDQIVRMAEDYYPKVVNNMEVGGVQQVAMKCMVMEVSRTKLRAVGVDFAFAGNSGYVVSTVGGLINSVADNAHTIGSAGTSMQVGILGGDNFFAAIEFLRTNQLGKVLSEPTVTAISGRPAFFVAGGEFPILVPQSLGTVTVSFKQFGTRVDLVPLVLGNGNIRLEVRPEVSELDDTRGVSLGGTSIPSLRTRVVETAVEMQAGQTLALAGMLQTREIAQTKGVPYLADLPYFGVPFRRNRVVEEEIELLILVTPELVDPLDAHEVPPCGPGNSSQPPSDCDFYWKGHIEVPAPAPCGPGRDCGTDGCEVMDYGAPDNVIRPEALEGPTAAPVYEEVPPTPDMGLKTKSKLQPVTYGRGSVSDAHKRKPKENSTAAIPTDTTRSIMRQSPQKLPKTTDLQSDNSKPVYATDQGLIGPIGYDVSK